MRFNPKKGRFSYSFHRAPGINAPLVLFVPRIHFGEGLLIKIPDGHYVYDAKEQLLFYHPGAKEGVRLIELIPIAKNRALES